MNVGMDGFKHQQAPGESGKDSGLPRGTAQYPGDDDW